MRGKRMSIRLLFAATVGLLIAAGCGPEYPNCNNDSDCHEAEFCVNGQCQQCRPDGNDCPAGQQCADGRCDPIPGWCGSGSDCPGGEECLDNRCVRSQMTGSLPQDMSPGQCSLSSVSFAYDSSEISSGAGNAAEANARCIQERDIPHVTLTGHCDPRGTEEYNLALGDRRARAVRSYMGRLGVSTGRMSSRSMGEEMARGSSESGWSQDRRVEVEER